MREKKQPGRFTLQFNMEDPQQKTVSELLEQQGRHKAQFITSAVLQYVQSPISKVSDNDLAVVDKDTMVQMMLSIMEKFPQFAAAPPDESSHTEKPTVKTPANKLGWNNPIGDDAMMAISETLAAFQQE